MITPPSWLKTSGDNLYIVLFDAASNQPITSGACITGLFSTTPAQKNWEGQDTCSSGTGADISLQTDNTGVAEYGIPYTCPMTFTLLAQAPGYEDTQFDFTTGVVTGPITYAVYMPTGTMGGLGQAPPYCTGLQADLNQTGQTAGIGASGAAGTVAGDLGSAGWMAVIAIVAIAIVLVVILVIAHPIGAVKP